MNEKSKITIRNSADVCLIEIEGTIGVPEEWQFDEPASRVATYEKFRETVEKISAIEAPEIVVDIRSTGGDVNDALLIHDALKGLDARITTRCFGYTASAATVIAQAASEGARKISANALYLVHKSSCAAEGNADELETHAEMLRKTDERLAELYASRSGHEAGEFVALMAENNGEGRWLSPAECIEAGLADVIMGEEAEKVETEPETEPGTGVSEPADTLLARGWMRLKAAVARHRTAGPPAASEDRNVLHLGEQEQEPRHAAVRSAMSFGEAQKRVEPTSVRPVEDPSLGDVRRSSNDDAYRSDARSFAR